MARPNLGVEQNACLYGNARNAPAEILLDRYDRVVTHHVLTHLLSNLTRRSTQLTNAPSWNLLYGGRLRSRLREVCNALTFSANSPGHRR